MTILFDPTTNIPSRKSPRWDQLDYSDGDYFITVCAQGHRHAFGYIQHDRMHLNQLGEAVARELQTEITAHHPYATVPVWTVMPNHIHAIIHLETEEDETRYQTPLAQVVSDMKRSVTLFAHQNGIPFAWQSRYHDHFIRDNNDRNYIADYIEHNVIRWAMDRFYEP
jgi:REP element-mobilizing transposase RayT